MRLPEDLVREILRYLDLASLQRFQTAALGDGGGPARLWASRRLVAPLVARRRVPWAAAVLDRGGDFPPGACAVHGCDRQRLSLFDLTGPVNYTFVLAPYCGECAAKYRGPYWYAL